MVDTSEIIGMYIGLILLLIFTIFVYYFITKKTEWGFYKSGLIAIIIWLFSSGITIIIKSRIGHSLNYGYAFLLNLITTLLIVGAALLALFFFPIIGRAFENTIGYSFVSNIRDITGNVFKSVSQKEYDHSLLLTQLFDEKDQVDNYLNNMKKIGDNINPKSPFKDIYVVENNEDNINLLKDIVRTKHSISEATFISLATIVSSLVCFLPIIYTSITSSSSSSV